MKFIQFEQQEAINLDQIMAIQFSESKVKKLHTIWFVGQQQKEAWIFEDKSDFKRAKDFINRRAEININLY